MAEANHNHLATNCQGRDERVCEATFSSFVRNAINASIAVMATLTIRKLDEKTKARLRVRAAHHGRSMEEEAREILRSAVSGAAPQSPNLAESIRKRFATFGGVELKLPKRDSLRQPPDFAA